MIDVVAVILDKDGGVKYVMGQYIDRTYEPAAPTVPASEFERNNLGFESDPIKMAQWVYPSRWRLSAIRFQSEADLLRLPSKLSVPGAAATFMDTADYEAWLVMLKLAEA